MDTIKYWSNKISFMKVGLFLMKTMQGFVYEFVLLFSF
jgi:hypothetical protein